MKGESTQKISCRAKATIPTASGPMVIMAYADSALHPMPHLVLAHPEYHEQESQTVRIHSECITGDVFGSKRCDCGQQLVMALRIIEQSKGLLIYLRQEGRGIGLINKLKAYRLQDEGLNTLDANLHLGFEPDERDYSVALSILNDLNICRVRLLTNNPDKIEAFEAGDIELIETIPLEVEPTEDNIKYLKTKKELMGHILRL